MTPSRGGREGRRSRVQLRCRLSCSPATALPPLGFLGAHGRDFPSFFSVCERSRPSNPQSSRSRKRKETWSVIINLQKSSISRMAVQKQRRKKKKPGNKKREEDRKKLFIESVQPREIFIQQRDVANHHPSYCGFSTLFM